MLGTTASTVWPLALLIAPFIVGCTLYAFAVLRRSPERQSRREREWGRGRA